MACSYSTQEASHGELTQFSPDCSYTTYMQQQNRLARWLFKHLSHHYVQADWNTPYTIMHSTILGNSYLVNNARISDQVRYVCEALDELKNKANVIGVYHKHMITGPRKKIEDVKYDIRPSVAFKDQMITANNRHLAITQKALEPGFSVRFSRLA